MGPVLRCFKDHSSCMAILLLASLPWNAAAQTCQTANDMDATLRTAITNAADRYFGMSVRGDSASLRQSAIPSLASDFAGVDNTIKVHQQELAGAQREEHGARPDPSLGVGIFNRKASSAAKARATAMPPTQAVHPSRSKSWPRMAVPTMPPKK